MTAPTDDASYLQTLKQIRANLATMLQTETAYWNAHGPKPTYSLDGRNVSWTEWLTGILDKMTGLNETIQKFEPYEWHVRSYT